MSVIVQLHSGRSLISRLIKWQTRSPVSHASVLFTSDDTVLESIEGVGVRAVSAKHYAKDLAEGRITQYRVPKLSRVQVKTIRDFMTAELGAGYDYGSVLKFITRRKAAHNARWFCSELVFAAFAAAGVPLLQNVEAWAVSPGDLAMSPVLERVK